jgi:hypothetical protein
VELWKAVMEKWSNELKKKELSSLQIHKPKILLHLKKHMSLTSNIDGLILIQLNHQVSGIWNENKI